MTNVVLITGVSRYLGRRLAAQLAADPAVERIIGIDTVPPRPEDFAPLGRTEFVRADIRNPLIAKVISQAAVDTVVHCAVLSSQGARSGRVPMQEMNLIGTMQLLAACQNSESVTRLVVKSTTAVYGSSPGDPALFTEDMSARQTSPAGFAADAVEVEGYIRGLRRRRPDLAVTVLRLANLIGPTAPTTVGRYLAMPVVPTCLGFDPRLQLLHDSDAVEVLRVATVSGNPGTFNVAGDGVLLLSQAVRKASRLRLPVPAPAIATAGRLVRNTGVLEFSADQTQFLNFGRVVDTTALKKHFGYTPRYTTAEALESYLRGRPALAQTAGGMLARAGQRLGLVAV